MADVRKVSVKDTHGHTIVDFPVDKEGIGSVLEPVVAATKAIADTVGDVTFEIETRHELPQQASSSAEGPSGTKQQKAGGRRGEAGGGVTQEDIERIRRANAVPTGDEARAKRIAPEQGGEPDLKDTGEWPDVRQRRK